MSCVTCGHTMHQFGCHETDRQFFWCPRCGTVKTCESDVHAPALVERCRKFLPAIRMESTVGGTVRMAEIADHWHGLGIDESINTPENRP